MLVPVSDIIIVHKRRLVRIKELAESIRANDLLHSLVINSKKELVCGLRRLTAVKLLGWKQVECTVIDTDALDAYLDENAQREPLAPSDVYAVHQLVEGTLKVGRPKLGEKRGGLKASEITGRKVGLSGRQVEKIVAVVRDAGKDERYQAVAEYMERPAASINRAYSMYMRLKNEDRPRVTQSGKVHCGLVEEVLPTLHDESFSAVFADPDWNSGFTYDGRKAPIKSHQEYSEWIKGVHAECMRVLRPGGFVFWMLGQTQLRNVWDWFGDKLRLFMMCRRMPPMRTDSYGMYAGWNPCVIAFKGTCGQIKAVQPQGRAWCHDFHVGELGLMKRDRLANRHNCPKNQDTLEAVIDMLVPRDGKVLDLFSGSGTVSAAALALGRDYLAVEENPTFVNNVEERLLRDKAANAV